MKGILPQFPGGKRGELFLTQHTQPSDKGDIMSSRVCSGGKCPQDVRTCLFYSDTHMYILFSPLLNFFLPLHNTQ